MLWGYLSLPYRLRCYCITKYNPCQYRKQKSISEDEFDTNAFLEDKESNLNAAAVYWNANYVHFKKVTNANSAARQGTAIPAYLLSMSTLVAFGLILKHAEKAKEKEDEETVLR